MAEKKYYIHIPGTIVEVSKEIYEEYYHLDRKLRTLEEKDQRHGLIHYNNFDTDDSLGEEIITEWTAESVEETVIRNLMIANLRVHLAKLPVIERDLIHAIFYDQISEADIGKRLGISQKAVNKRKKKILQKLQKLFNK